MNYCHLLYSQINLIGKEILTHEKILTSLEVYIFLTVEWRKIIPIAATKKAQENSMMIITVNFHLGSDLLLPNNRARKLL